jgi:phage antirepressor YoqD-like protein
MQNSLKVLPATQTMSSLQIAELTGKDHPKVTADIKRVLEEAGIEASGFRIPLKMPSGQTADTYNLPYRETQLVISGYSVKHRLVIIDRWQELETNQPKLPTNFIEALEALLISEKEKQVALTQIETDRPKVEFAIAVRNMQGACSVGDFAKTIGYGRNKFFKMMRDDGILIKNNVPYQKYIDMGCFVVMEQIPYTDSNGKTHPAFTTMITGKGQVFLEKKYRKDAV